MGSEHQDMEAWSDTIVTTCAIHKRDHSNDRDYLPYLTIGEDHLVKFGDPQTLTIECAVRECISAHAATCPLGSPRIPRLLLRFQRESTMYLVMERVPLAEDFAPSFEEAEAMLRWIEGVSLPQSFPVCRLGGGCIRDRFFKDAEAPFAFSSVEALQRYLDRVRSLLSFYSPL